MLQCRNMTYFYRHTILSLKKKHQWNVIFNITLKRGQQLYSFPQEHLTEKVLAQGLHPPKVGLRPSLLNS